MALIAAIGLDCDVCQGRFMPFRASTSLATFHFREKWKFVPEYEQILDFTASNGTPTILNTFDNSFIVGLPTDPELARYALLAFQEIHDKDYKKVFGAGPTPSPLGSLASYGVVPSMIISRIFDIIEGNILEKDHMIEEVRSSLKALDRISKVLSYGLPTVQSESKK